MFKCLLICLLVLANERTYADNGKVTGKVEFMGIATPGFLKVPGEGGTLEGQVQIGADGKATGTFTVQLKPFKTGMSLRDKHMHEKYLETAKFPEAKLVLLPWTPTPAESTFDAALTLKGVTKTVTGVATYRNGKLLAEFKVDTTQYPIGVPEWLGVSVGKEVTVTVEADVK